MLQKTKINSNNILTLYYQFEMQEYYFCKIVDNIKKYFCYEKVFGKKFYKKILQKKIRGSNSSADFLENVRVEQTSK